MNRLARCPALAAALLVTGGLLVPASPLRAEAIQPGGPVVDMPTLSNEPRVAQRQALGCSVVGLGLTGVALASGVAATGGGAVAGGPAVAELLAYFGAGCTMGAFIATAFSVQGTASEADTPAQAPADDPTLEKRRLRIEAAALLP